MEGGAQIPALGAFRHQVDQALGVARQTAPVFLGQIQASPAGQGEDGKRVQGQGGRVIVEGCVCIAIACAGLAGQRQEVDPFGIDHAGAPFRCQLLEDPGRHVEIAKRDIGVRLAHFRRPAAALDAPDLGLLQRLGRIVAAHRDTGLVAHAFRVAHIVLGRCRHGTQGEKDGAQDQTRQHGNILRRQTPPR
jgi:hypothetical protein